VNRRVFVRALSIALIATPYVVEAQTTPRVCRVGFIGVNAREPLEPFIRAFEEGLRDRGDALSYKVAVEYRFGNGRPERLSSLSAELAQLNIDVFVVPFTTVAEVVQNAAPRSPIVVAFGGDFVNAGLAQSLARPGGRVTGLTVSTGPEIIGKNLQLLSDALPQQSSIGMLFNRGSQINAVNVTAADKAARDLGLRLIPAGIRGADDLSSALTMMKRENARGVLVLDEPLFYANRRKVNDLALRNGLAPSWPVRPGVDAGGLISYGVSLPALYRRAASYVEKICQGANPGDLPIEQPTKFELVINLKTAKALGLTIPPSLLLRADHVIE
jgi:putative tryptophan/tyrosine transport system substrate-binding protein